MSTPDEYMTEMADPEQHTFVCENCGRTDSLTNAEAYETGWDYPPFMGDWGTLMGRTCPNCGIETTTWWQLVVLKREFDDLTPTQQKLVLLVKAEEDAGGVRVDPATVPDVRDV